MRKEELLGYHSHTNNNNKDKDTTSNDHISDFCPLGQQC